MSEDTDLEADVRAALEGTAPPEPQVQEAEPVEAEEGRARDEHGRFAPKVDKPQETQQPAQAVAEEPERTISPPHTWTATAKAKFNALDPEIQQEVLRREKEMNDGKAQWDTKAQLFNRLDEVLSPVDARLALNGLDRPGYIRALVAADELLRNNPQAGFQQLAQLYGYQIPGAQQAYQQPQVDPSVKALQDQVAQLSQAWQSQAQAQEQAKMQAVTGQIEAFRNDPKHIYFDNVKPKMVALLQSEQAADLAEAYDMACYADPTVRALLSAKPVTAAKPGTPRPIQATGSPGQTKPSAQSNSRTSHEDDVRAALEELAGRV